MPIYIYIYSLECNSGIGEEEASGDDVCKKVEVDKTVNKVDMEVANKTTMSEPRGEGT